jgi:hypothetical protein
MAEALVPQGRLLLLGRGTALMHRALTATSEI